MIPSAEIKEVLALGVSAMECSKIWFNLVKSILQHFVKCGSHIGIVGGNFILSYQYKDLYVDLMQQIC